MTADSPTGIYRHILIPTDGSDLAQKAVLEGSRLAESIGARVTIVAVLEPLWSMGDREHAFAGLPESARLQALDFLNADARHALDRAATAAVARQVQAETTMIEAPQVHQAIIDTAARRSCDLIVMGSHGRRGLAAAVLGSVTQKVLTRAHVPVLVVR